MSGTSRSCWRCGRAGSQPPSPRAAVPISDPMCVSQQQFSADISPKASSVCLAHLFTYQDFDEGTLGLAYVAPSKPDIAGGLCSKGPHHQHPPAAVAATPLFSTLLSPSSYIVLHHLSSSSFPPSSFYCCCTVFTCVTALPLFCACFHSITFVI